MHRFPLLPEWLVFFVTSRPEDTVQFRLKKYNPCVRICAGNIEHHSNFYQQHDQDIKFFLRNSVDFSRLPFSVDDIAKKCKGSFLYAFYIAKDLNVTMQSGKPLQLVDLFPGDFDSYLLKNFKRVLTKSNLACLRSCLVVPSPPQLRFLSRLFRTSCREKSRVSRSSMW
ncbi:hypothetical protein OS493_004825 [Desmophyllum pertusum]|uniref:Uncharacterized protein n=1 Tax=Desmophyllum pertusum TaxID=174260 RepID=A0A9X0CUB2_9CNID|nr:hypothetical protein OS493_004825 [Desmophyllum pertusum]